MFERIFDFVGWGGVTVIALAMLLLLDVLLRLFTNALAWRRGYGTERARQ